MARPVNADLSVDWKLKVPAPLAGAVELLLWDHTNNKPKYGARNKLITALLQSWLDQQNNLPACAIPTAEQLRGDEALQ